MTIEATAPALLGDDVLQPGVRVTTVGSKESYGTGAA